MIVFLFPVPNTFSFGHLSPEGKIPVRLSCLYFQVSSIALGRVICRIAREIERDTHIELGFYAPSYRRAS